MKRLLGFSFLLNFALAINAQVTMETAGDGILITEQGNKILFYQIEPKSKSGEYERNNYIHPLWGIDGRSINTGFP